ncbi:TetR/AcrR family transcriptional regulator [Microbacterium sp. AK031]|uniref:TetR/AcrR family transcriptional regulator n=1 Tax=Microbacterium sp. AK031 TaxID=2723076 RepID=UPI0021692D34|nr:TetR/AcrR family transcriptional regulator [Microbacterium sp. AK031]MCS3844493.1 AcrR family transcriptional regulator [Microbacterium sp. AK031]
MTDAGDGGQGARALSPERRTALAEATVAEFARAGYEAASLNRIIRDAGMSKSSFYHFVGSKSELFDAVVRMLVADVRAQWTPPAPAEFGARAFWRRVDAMLGEFATLSASPALQYLGRIFYLPGDAASAVSGGARGELLDAVREWVEAVLRAGRESGQVRDDLPLDLQVEVTFAVLRAIDEWALTGQGAEASGRAAVAASAPAVLLHRLLAP